MFAALSTTLLLALAAPQSGDQIVFLDGSVLQVERVLSENYTEVVYRKNSQESRKPSDTVQEVRHSLTPRDLGDYKDAIAAMEDADYALALAAFNVVLNDKELQAEARYAWTRQHALHSMMLCYAATGNMNQVAATADRLLKEVPDTFFYGRALLTKAQALQDKGDAAGAAATYQQLLADVGAKGLPEIWSREAELGLAIGAKGGAPADKQRKLEGLAEKNKEQYPSVANRARVEVGYAMVEAEQFKDAKARFQSIVDVGLADRETLAAAYSGLGDCAYNMGLREQDTKKAAALYEEAALHFLRTAATYPEAFRLVPRALCHAGMSMVRIQKREDAIAIANKLKRNYPNSEWKAKLFQDMNLAQ
jgi:TolA-binding protein